MRTGRSSQKGASRGTQGGAAAVVLANRIQGGTESHPDHPVACLQLVQALTTQDKARKWDNWQQNENCHRWGRVNRHRLADIRFPRREARAEKKGLGPPPNMRFRIDSGRLHWPRSRTKADPQVGRHRDAPPPPMSSSAPGRSSPPGCRMNEDDGQPRSRIEVQNAGGHRRGA